MKNIFGKIFLLGLAISACLGSRAQAETKSRTYDLASSWLAGELDFLCPDPDTVSGCDKEIFYCRTTVEEHLLDHLNNPKNCSSIGNDEWACEASQLAAVNDYAAGLQSLTEVNHAETCASSQAPGSPNFDKNLDGETLQELQKHYCYSSTKKIPLSCQKELTECQDFVGTYYSSQVKLAQATGRCVPQGDNLACQGHIYKVLLADLEEQNSKRTINSDLGSCEAAIAVIAKYIPTHAILTNDGDQNNDGDPSEGSKDTVPTVQGTGAQPAFMLAGSGCSLIGGSEISLDPAWIALLCSSTVMAFRGRRKH